MCFPSLDHGADGLAKVAARQADLDRRPVPNPIEDRAGALLAVSLRLGIAGKRARHEALDGVQLANQPLDLVEFAHTMDFSIGTGARILLRRGLVLCSISTPRRASKPMSTCRAWTSWCSVFLLG